MAKVAVLTFGKDGKFTSKIVDGDFSEEIKKPGHHAVIGLVSGEEKPKKEPKPKKAEEEKPVEETKTTKDGEA